ncbi:MAG: hypothetical protein SVV80_03015 [Planctomycetota bacterium]|nr:hypothetical protein [Planctomycetota bacterium]
MGIVILPEEAKEKDRPGSVTFFLGMGLPFFFLLLQNFDIPRSLFDIHFVVYPLHHCLKF